MKRPAARVGLVIGLVVLATASLHGQSLFVRAVEDRDHVTVMEFGGIYDRQPEENREYEQMVRQEIAREFFRTHRDDYDFLVVFARFKYELGSDTEGAQVGGRYYGIKNDVQGIGQELFDLSDQFGSTGRLQGYVDMGVLSRLVTDPTDPAFETTLSILAHEYAHRWAAHVRFKDADGSLSTSLLGRDGAHWSFLLQSHNSVLYGNDWRDNGDGTFTSIGRPGSFYSPLDLYLMGMLDKPQVPPFFLVDDPDIDPGRLPEVGVHVSGSPRTVSIDDVIAAEGERIPSAGSAPKRFKMGFIFLVRPGEQADGLELRAINTIREAFSTRVLILTSGKGVIEVYPEQPAEAPPSPAPILPPSSGPRPGGVDLVQGVDWLLSRQRTDGGWGDSESTQVRDTAAALDLLKEIPSTFSSHENGLAWLTARQESSNVDTVSRRLVAMAPQFSAPDATFLADARNPDGGWGLRGGYQSDAFDTALASMALPQGDPGPAFAYLIANQNPDGGWGLRPSSASSIQATAAVLRLASRYQSGELDGAIAKALAWLPTRQQPDGGFGDAGSTVYDTAQAALALVKTSFPKPDLARAVEYLKKAQLADGSWNESVYQTALAIRALKTGELPNAAVAAPSLAFSPAGPVEGQPVTISAQVANEGVVDVANLLVRVFDGDPSAGGVQVGDDVTIALLPGLSQIPISVVWDTSARVGEHSIVVSVDPDRQVDEFNEADNVVSGGITVRPPPQEPDLAVRPSDLSFNPVLLQSVPQPQTLMVTIANIGQTAVSQAGVSLFDGDPDAGGVLVAGRTVDVAGRGTSPVTFTFEVTASGEHRYFVVLDPLNQIAEAEEGNNRASAALPVQSTLDFFVADGSVAFSQNPVALGQILTVTAQVGNRGTTGAFAIPVRFVIEHPDGAIDLGTQTVDLAAGETRSVSATWRTSRVLSDVPLAVVIDPANAKPESSENNNRAAALLSVLSSTLPNLFVTYTELQVTSPVLQGGNATITVPVHNNGFADVADVSVAFYQGVPGSGGVQLGQLQSIPLLGPGAQATASVPWDQITTTGDKLVYVVADPSNTITEFDEEDNVAFVTVKVLSRPDLTVTSSGMAFSPAFPKEDDDVVVTAGVANQGDQPANNVRVRFFDGSPAGGLQIGADQVIAQVPGRGQGTAQVVLGMARIGARSIYVQADPLNEIVEGDETNNTAFRTLGVQDASLWFSSLYFSPNGDDVQDTTELFFRLAGASTATRVRVRNRKGAEVRSFDLAGGQTEGSIAWDGRDAAGRVAPDGDYSFALMAADGRESASAKVAVDTNNLPVSEAVGTPFLLETNLTCDAKGFVSSGAAAPSGFFQTAGWLPDDSGLVQWLAIQAKCPPETFYFFICPHEFVEAPGAGVYVTSPDGLTRTRITPDSWTIHPPAGNGTQLVDVKISPDGERVFVALRRYMKPNLLGFEYVEPVEFWVVNVDGSGLTQVGTANTSNTSQSYLYAPRSLWSPDGQKIAVASYDDSIPTGQLYVLNADGSGQTLVRSLGPGLGNLGEPGWSPDSRKVLFSFTDVSPDGWFERVHAVNIDGAGEIRIASVSIDLARIHWLGSDRFAALVFGDPDASGVFVVGASSRTKVWLFSTTGLSPQLLSTSAGDVADVVASPDGRSLIYDDRDSGSGLGPNSTGIWRVDANGVEERIYTPTENNRGIGELAWSSDGRKVAFIEGVVSEYKVCTGTDEDGQPFTRFCGTTFSAIGLIDLAESSTRLTRAAGGNLSFPVGLLPDGSAYLAWERTDEFFTGARVRFPIDLLSTIDLEDGTRTPVLPLVAENFETFEFTPSGKYLRYEAGRDSFDESRPCWKGHWSGQTSRNGGSDQWLLTSLLNLTTQFGFQREQGQLLIRGTAQDLNFAGYRLEYAGVASPDAWSLIAEGETPVVNDVLGRWIPPSEGSFYVRLTAEDKAGNQQSVRKRITWGLTPTITNVSITPRSFSPNGDGTKDSATVNYFVLGPVHLEFNIHDNQDNLVRRIAQDHPAMGPASIAWDGRDEAGQFVADGIYRIQVLDLGFFVTVDTTPPDVRAIVGSGLQTVSEKLVCGETPTGVACALIPGPLIDTPFRLLSGHATDSSLADWKLEAGDGLSPAEWFLLDEGTDVQAARDTLGVPKVPVEDVALRRFDQPGDVVGKRFRLTATDQAGNTAVATSDFAPEEIILYGWDGFPVPTTRVIEQSLGPHTISIEQTVRAPLQWLTLQYRLLGSALWTDGPAVSLPAARVALPWNTASLGGGKTYEIRIVGLDFDGHEFVSNGTTIHSDLFALTEINDELQVAKGVASLRETLTDLRLVLSLDGTTPVGGSAAFSDPVNFVIPFSGCELVKKGITAGPVQLRGVGQSGRVYHSNRLTLVPFCPGAGTGDGELEGRIGVTAATQRAVDCNQPAPGRVTIQLFGTGIDEGSQTLAIQEAPNGLLREVPGVTLPFTMQLDTTGRPEGAYLVRATGTVTRLVEGRPVVGETTATARFVVDRRPPAAQITYPGVNQPFCPVRSGEAFIVPIHGTAQDPNFDHYELEFGHGEAPQSWTPFFPGPQEQAASQVPKQGVLANWDVTQQPAGTDSLRLKAFDQGGNLTCSMVTFSLRTPAKLQSLAADRRLFSPNGDATFDQVMLTYSLDQNALIDAKVFPIHDNQPAATPIRTILAGSPQLTGTHSFIWDGLSDAGAAVPDGPYSVVVSATDACGNTAQASTAIVVDNTLPEAVIASPRPADTLGVLVEIRGGVADVHFDGYTLEVGEGGSPTAWIPLASGFAPVGNDLLGKWNNQGEAGTYTLRLTATDGAGNRRFALVPVTVGDIQPLVTDLAVQPFLFSPNGDGRLDTTTVRYQLSANADVVVDVVDGAGALVKALSNASGLPPGSHEATWAGGTDAGTIVPDGDYRVRIMATAAADPAHTQTETTTARIDATPPSLSFETPVQDGHLRGDVAVVGTATDPNIDTYAVSYGAASDGPAITLDEGRQSRTHHAFGTIQGLADGAYTVRLRATDLAQNESTLAVGFRLDDTAPSVVLAAPAQGALLGGPTPSVAVRGSVVDSNLKDWTLRVASGLDPPSWRTIAAGTTAPDADLLATWDVAALADGAYIFSLVATDKAGASAEATVSVTLDNTPPTASISQPPEAARIGAPVEIIGDVIDAHLISAVLELSEGEAANAFKYVELARYSGPVTNGSLFSWRALPADGAYTLRLTAEDRLGSRSIATRTVRIDTRPPEPPTDLAAQLENRKDARLTWTASNEPAAEVAGYHVYRDAKKLTTAPIAATAFVDQDLGDGTHRYRVTAVDLANLESVPSNEASVRVDLTAPLTRLHAPANGTVVSGLVDVRGTAASAEDFKEYRVLAGAGNAPASFNLVRRAPTPVTAGVLAQYDTIALAEGSVVTIRLEAEDLGGNTATDQVTVTIDNVPPRAPVLLAATPSGSDMTVAWEANPEADLAGYLLYNNDLLANARRIVSGSLMPYLVSGTTFRDKALPDGDYKYYLFAVDKAGNLSDPSNTLRVTLETRAPKAAIVQPATGTKTQTPILLVATAPDEDVARVQFQFKAAAATTWTDLGLPIATRPYQATWDPAGLGHGDYHFRAVATDVRANTDPSPSTITIRHQDVTAPTPPTGLTARVTEGTVALSWSASGASDLAGYLVYRRIGPSGKSRLTPTPITTTTYTDQGVPVDGHFTYTVTAVDTAGNESGPADVSARIYRPTTSAPNLCTPEATTAVTGTGAEPDSTVTVFVDTGSGPVASGTALAGADGSFTFDAVALVGGNNVLTAQAVDSAGNTSRRSVPLTVSNSPTPEPPAGFTASVNGFDVALSWDPSARPLAGYSLSRGNALLNPPADTPSTGEASASSRDDRAWRAIDGDPDSSWFPSDSDPTPWWQLDFGQPVSVKTVEIDWFRSDPDVFGARDFELQRWDGVTWVTIQAFQENTSSQNVVTLATPVSTSRMRISTTRLMSSFLGLAEVRVFEPVLIQGTSFADADVPDGKHTYRLRAVNLCGVEGPAAEARADVGDVVAPAPPLNLTATVSGSDVTLQWTGGAEGDLDGYNLYRRSETSDWTKLNSAPIAATTTIDALVRNGSYLYRVTAIDVLGNESGPSSEASTLVGVPLPPVPVLLSVTTVPAGQSLDIVWASGNASTPVAGYRLFRSLLPGGPYDEATGALVTGTTYRDTGLTNGLTHYYVVRAHDAAGNASAPSNEGSGTPGDAVAPEQPLLGYPTDASHPRTLATGTTPVTGASEAGSAVTVLRGGRALGTTSALSASLSDTVTLPAPYSLPTFYRPEALLGAFSQPPGGSASVLTITDVVTGATRYYAQVADALFGLSSFSAEGRQVAYMTQSLDPATGGNVYHLHLFDRVEGTVSRTVDLPGFPANLAFSPAGSQLAVIIDGQIWRLEAATGATTPITTGANAAAPVWSPDGTRIAYLDRQAGAFTLRLVEVSTGAVTDVDAQPVAAPVVFSPDGTVVAFASTRSGRADLWLYELSTSVTSPVPSDGPDVMGRQGPAFSPDGASLAYLKQSAGSSSQTLCVRNLTTGDVLPLASSASTAPVFWTADRTLVQVQGAQMLRHRLPGHFRIDDVPLDAGLNVLSAITTDSAGNTSAPADPIEVTRDTSVLTDLEVADADLFIYPLYPAVGEVVRISATARNSSDQPASDIGVVFLDTNAQGTVSTIGSVQAIAGLGPGEQVVVSAEWHTTGLSGRHTLSVVVDPLNVIAEISETNNRAARDAVVTPEGGPTVAVRADRVSYPPAGTVAFVVDLTNPSLPGDFALDVRIEDTEGFAVVSVLHEDLPALGYATRSFSGSWPASGVLSGAYQVRAVLTHADGPSFAASAPFTIEADETVIATVATDRGAYLTGESVLMTGRVRNASVNADLRGLRALTQVLDAQGAEVFRAEAELGTLLLDSETEVQNRWPAAVPGSYTVRFAVQSAAGERASAMATFTAVGSGKLEGAVQVPAAVPIGEDVTFSAEAANRGTIGADGVTLRLLLVDPARQTAVRSFERVVDLPAGATVPWTVSTNSAGLRIGIYRVALQAERGPAIEPLASATFSVVDAQAPAVAITSPAPGTHHNQAVPLAALVTDNATGVDRVEFRIDQGSWTSMALADLAAGRFAATYAASGATEGMRTLQVRASDKAGNTDATSSTDANPAALSFTIDVTPPAIVVTGVEDGQVYRDPVTPAISISDAHLATQRIELDGVAFPGGTPVTARGDHVLEVSATDRAGNLASQVVRFTLGLNQPPTAHDQAVITAEDTPVAITLEASDPDGDPLQFTLTQPASGTLSGTAPHVLYTPQPDFHGSDSFTYTASDGEESAGPATVSITVSPVNDVPVASAGPDRSVSEGDSVVLDGSGSHDDDGDPLTHGWTQLAGPPVTLDVVDPVHPTFAAPPVPTGGSTLTFGLVVSDGQSASQPAVVNVTVKNVNRRPVAEAGPDQRVREDSPVTLDGSASYDPDAERLTFSWLQTAGSPVQLSDPAAAQASFTAPLVGRAGEELTFELTVSDGIDSATDHLDVLVEDVNHRPRADAGPDQTKDEESIVTLDGTASNDPDGDPLTYAWTQRSGPPVVLSDASSAMPSFTTPAVASPGATLVFQLVVDDGLAESAADEVSVHVLDIADAPRCDLAQASLSILWPPNHKLVRVRIAGLSDARDEDNCHGDDDDDDDDHAHRGRDRAAADAPEHPAHSSGDDDHDDDGGGRCRCGSIPITRVTQDEPVNGLGDGDTSPDAVIQGSTVLLRAERSGTGNGRVYRVYFTARNCHGGTCTGWVTVGVPHSRRPRDPIIDDGQLYDSTQR